MDTKKFFQEMRKIIREEVNRAIDERTTSQSNNGETFKKDMSHAMKLQEQVKKAPPKENPTLQDLLNETKDSMFSERTLNFNSSDARGFNRGAMAQMLGYGDMGPRGSAPIPPTDIDGRPVMQLDPTVEKALTKDYSAIMKALKDKKKI